MVQKPEPKQSRMFMINVLKYRVFLVAVHPETILDT
jgi:hypothetical protein